MIMKKILLFTPLIFCGMSMAWSQGWVGIHSMNPSPAKTRLVESNVEQTVLHFQLDGFYLNEVETPKGAAHFVTIDDGTPILESGAPDLPKLTVSVIVPNLANMAVQVLESEYTEFHDVLIAPSKGNFTRDIDPSSVPYVFGKTYNRNEFYPSSLAQLRTPYILRDYRGQTVVIFPFQYNPILRTLRVYHSVTVEIKRINDKGINPLIRDGDINRVDAEFNRIYNRHFINIQQARMRYEPLEEQGNMLIICYPDFIDEMGPFVEWKRMTGIHTELVDVSTIGDAEEIKTFVETYYYDNGLTFLLLVGDAAQVPTHPHNGVTASDNSYGYITGDDSYPELFVGRFSAETPEQVTTQVTRVIHYEKTPLTDTDWFTYGVGIASSQGPGDDDELDYEHMRNMQDDLLNYTYTYCSELFDGSQGGEDEPDNPIPDMVAEDVNAGASVILYTGHGSGSSWGTSGFSNSDVNELTNTHMLPFIWSVACNNGTFNGYTCFAEAWLRATDSQGEPTGAVATLMSTISQSWDPPMEAQDEMVDILVESYTNNIKHTFGGISMNGCMQMNDTYGADGYEETDAWTCFGDPSLMVRTAFPQDLVITHNDSIFIGSSGFTVNCNTEGAVVALTVDSTILGTAIVQQGVANVIFDPLLQPGIMTVTATAYNRIPAINQVNIVPADGPYVIFQEYEIDDSAANGNGQLDYGEEVWLNVSLANVGIEEASNVSAVLNSSEPYITIPDNSELYGLILPGESKLVNHAFAIEVSPDVPDGQTLLFTLQITGDERTLWNSSFVVTAHAPVLELGACIVEDPDGNNNGKLDPGENAQIVVQILNTGTSDAVGVEGWLSSQDPYITFDQPQAMFGDIPAEASGEGVFTVFASENTPTGHAVDLLLDITANQGITGQGTFMVIVGPIPALILDLDPNHSSAPLIQETLDNIGVNSDYLLTFPADLHVYSSVFVCLGVFWNNHILNNEEGTLLANYLNIGGNIYMEGGDTWAFNSPTPVHPMFMITGVGDGNSDMGIIVGQEGTLSEGMLFPYQGENSYMDRIEPIAPAVSLFRNENPEYGCAVANDGGTYRTIGASFEFGGLVDQNSPSTRFDLMTAILDFFGIQTATLGIVGGTVIEAQSGAPIAGAQVSVGSYLTFTAYDGTYSGHFPVGEWPLCAVAPGHEMICQSIQIIEDSTVTCDFVLTYLSPPFNLQAELIENIATLAWEMESARPFNHFCIYRSKDEGDFQMVYTTTEVTYQDVLTQSGLYNYYVTAMYGENSESDPTNMAGIEFTATGITNPDEVPQQTKLGSNYPNPFTDQTLLRFNIARDGQAVIEIYRIDGDKVRNLFLEHAKAGYHEVVWDGKDDLGRPVPAGIYVYRLTSSNFLHSRKMVLMR